MRLWPLLFKFPTVILQSINQNAVMFHKMQSSNGCQCWPAHCHSSSLLTPVVVRRRELLMTAAQSIKTPVMNLPLRDPTLANAQQLTSRLRRISLAECLTGANFM